MASMRKCEQEEKKRYYLRKRLTKRVMFFVLVAQDYSCYVKSVGNFLYESYDRLVYVGKIFYNRLRCTGEFCCNKWKAHTFLILRNFTVLYISCLLLFIRSTENVYNSSIYIIGSIISSSSSSICNVTHTELQLNNLNNYP